MANVSVYNMEGKQIDTIELNDAVFGVEVNEHLVHMAVGQHRGPMAHGSKFHRHQGSNGACSSPSRVFKGKGMPGHMGCVKVTVQNLDVVRVDADKNLILVKGAVPGPKKALVTIKETVKVEA